MKLLIFIFGVVYGVSPTLTQNVSGVRQGGMGEAFVGIADDLTSLYYNPGGLPNIFKNQIQLVYLKDIEDLYWFGVNFAKAGILKNLGIGLGVISFNGGKIDILSYIDGTETTKTAQQDLLIILGGGYKLTPFSFGISLKYLSSKLVKEVKSSSLSIDLGQLWQVSDKIKLGFILQNLGPKITYQGGKTTDQKEELPLILKIGGSYQINFGENKLIQALDILKEKEKIKLNLGLEYNFSKFVSLRGGYKFGYDLESFTFGLGLKYSMLKLDYSFSPNSILGFLHHMGFIIEF